MRIGLFANGRCRASDKDGKPIGCGVTFTLQDLTGVYREGVPVGFLCRDCEAERSAIGAARSSQGRYMRARRAVVAFVPQSESALIITKPHYYADFNGETAVFPTIEEAVSFCWKRWRIPRADIRFDFSGKSL